jgi:hypothetical protein
MTPFVILALPRSRTAWLANFLSYDRYTCGHEELRHMRSLDDARMWLSQNYTGSAETAAAPWWRLIRHYRPDIRILIVRRAVPEVVNSLMTLNMQGVCAFDHTILTRNMHKLDRYLDRIEAAMPANVLSVRFSDLANRETCRQVFEHCLPYRFDVDWWADHAARNLQASMPALMRYYLTHKATLDAAARNSRRKMRIVLGARRSLPVVADDGVAIGQENFETMWRDGGALFTEHCIAVGEAPDQWTRKNLPLLRKMDDEGVVQWITARQNGRMLGYLVSVIGPSLEAVDLLTATQTLFFGTSDAAGFRIGQRLQSAAIEAAEARHVGEVYMRAGVRGQGARLGIMYRRMGAEPFGELYKLTLKAA